MKQRNKLLINTISSLAYQAISIICGFILPRVMLVAYGSEANGLVNSISQFLGLIMYLDLGIGAVVQSALYKPLAEKDTVQISAIFVSAQRYFRNIAKILLVYLAVLIVLFPAFSSNTFDPGFVAFLIVGMGLNLFSQYYFGVANQVLLLADQRAYIPNLLQMITTVLNVVICIILVRLDICLPIVKLATSVIFLIRPFFYKLYVDKHYDLDLGVQCKDEPLEQKWNGIAQHIAAVVLGGTDTIVLTFFSSLESVSVYSVYFLVVSGVQKIVLSATNGIQSYFGSLWAKCDIKKLQEAFGKMFWTVHFGTIIVFGCAASLIVPFIRVYTSGIHDINYIEPTFGLVLVLAYAFYCLRLPYSIMILAGNHFKQSQKSYIVAALLNIVVSVIMVVRFGLTGVAIGTLAAMVYQIIWMAWYNSKNLVQWPLKHFAKQILVDVLSFVCAYSCSTGFVLMNVDYWNWCILAVKTFLIWGGFTLLFNSLFYKKQLWGIIEGIFGRSKKVMEDK